MSEIQMLLKQSKLVSMRLNMDLFLKASLKNIDIEKLDKVYYLSSEFKYNGSYDSNRSTIGWGPPTKEAHENIDRIADAIDNGRGKS